MSAAIASTSTTTSRMPVNPIPPIQPIMSVIILSSYFGSRKTALFRNPLSRIHRWRKLEAKSFLDGRIADTDSLVAPLIAHIEHDRHCTRLLQTNECAHLAVEDLGLPEERVVLDLARRQVDTRDADVGRLFHS